MKQTKKAYVSPRIEVIELENEATVMTGSVTGMPNTDWTPKASTKSMYSAPSSNSSDLEDMINDILTIEN